jgi:hypothetical protein
VGDPSVAVVEYGPDEAVPVPPVPVGFCEEAEELVKTNGAADDHGVAVRLRPVEGAPLLPTDAELDPKLLWFPAGC